MGKIEFNGELYNDDRMFVLYLCKCTVCINDEVIETTIYHENAPDDHKWCLVTYRNIPRYIATRVDHFDSENDAMAYMKKVAPVAPLVSLGGKPPQTPLAYDEFVRWKKDNNFKEYDYKTVYTPGGTNHRETVLSKRQIK
ncbi:hypothetical protein KAR91_59295 [Candidatus Pacearchaeota archaeon]|nr:hypothetical protein [Candidatus Pacearchaeota archaeon]